MIPYHTRYSITLKNLQEVVADEGPLFPTEGSIYLLNSLSFSVCIVMQCTLSIGKE